MKRDRQSRRTARSPRRSGSRYWPNDIFVLRAKSALGQVGATNRSYDKAIAILDPIVRIEPSGRGIIHSARESHGASGCRTVRGAPRTFRSAASPSSGVRSSHLWQFASACRLRSGRSGCSRSDAWPYSAAEKLYRESLQIGAAWYG